MNREQSDALSMKLFIYSIIEIFTLRKRKIHYVITKFIVMVNVMLFSFKICYGMIGH